MWRKKAQKTIGKIQGSEMYLCELVNKPQKAMTDVLPVLEIVEDKLHTQFDKSIDCAQNGWREFRASATPWIRVDADLVDDSDACKRVVVGFREEPIYEFQCLEGKPGGRTIHAVYFAPVVERFFLGITPNSYGEIWRFKRR